eukprot:scaffold12489_cov27-Tisochrysis_lutea.AAC.5
MKEHGRAVGSMGKVLEHPFEVEAERIGIPVAVRAYLTSRRGMDAPVTAAACTVRTDRWAPGGLLRGGRLGEAQTGGRLHPCQLSRRSWRGCPTRASASTWAPAPTGSLCKCRLRCIGGGLMRLATGCPRRSTYTRCGVAGPLLTLPSAKCSPRNLRLHRGTPANESDRVRRGPLVSAMVGGAKAGSGRAARVPMAWARRPRLAKFDQIRSLAARTGSP